MKLLRQFHFVGGSFHVGSIEAPDVGFVENSRPRAYGLERFPHFVQQALFQYSRLEGGLIDVVGKNVPSA